jgi:hypothetical protein
MGGVPGAALSQHMLSQATRAAQQAELYKRMTDIQGAREDAEESAYYAEPEMKEASMKFGALQKQGENEESHWRWPYALGGGVLGAGIGSVGGPMYLMHKYPRLKELSAFARGGGRLAPRYAPKVQLFERALKRQGGLGALIGALAGTSLGLGIS